MCQRTDRVQECLAYNLCQYSGRSCGPCIEMLPDDWRAHVRALLSRGRPDGLPGTNERRPDGLIKHA